MSRKGKLRVGVPVAGHFRELFSVQDRANGDLGIYVKFARELAGHSSGDHAEIDEQRFSVHVSPKSPAHTITQTVVTQAGRRSTSALVHPAPAGAKTKSGIILGAPQFRWPIFAVRCPRLDNERYICEPKKRDDLAGLEEFDPSICSLVYLVAVTSSNVRSIGMTRGRTAACLLPFRCFNLHVIYAYALVPSLTEADFITFATSPERGGEQSAPLTQQRRGYVSGMDPIIEGYFFSALRISGDRYLERFAEAFRLFGVEEEDAGRNLLKVGAYGCVPSPPRTAEERREFLEAYLAESQAMKKARDAGDIMNWRSYLKDEPGMGEVGH